MAQIIVFSPAKINLFLAITGKREDGFHDLVSLVTPVSFGDEIEIRITEGERSVELECDAPGIPVDGRNLASKSAMLFMERYGIDAKVEIDLKKRIPSGAGLGGGSSNAAAVLKALNGYFAACEETELSQLSSEIGSDCPLFLKGKPVVMRGRGEEIEELPDEQCSRLDGLELLLYKPSLSNATPWAYGELSKFSGKSFMSQEEAELRLSQFLNGRMELDSLLFNSFEEPIFRKHRGIFEMQRQIQEEICVPTLMSGSGSACFAICEGERRERIREAVQDCWGYRVFAETASVSL
ncbi:4-(cytidine 5'-diphospho)-2-C-methyl-D-erythritol kinase [Puniceicoccaceae bacterium K14]|nr:4-(cytidine 5'-diphospho)-2-C-methyl-D-erythritol kinase [Puniceicoccaceae bacterium K14]